MTDKSKREHVHSEPTLEDDDIIPHIPDTPENIARTMWGKRMMPDGSFQYTEEGLRRVRERRANQR